MKHPWKRRRKAAVLLACAAALAGAGLIYQAASAIASPPRRKLSDDHREFLAHPERHGLRIDRFTSADGTPCLVCTPAGTPGDRGRRIRQQLSERGISPPPFGAVRGTLVLLHGRRGRKEDYLPIAERLCASGFRCVIPDLPAHGDHPSATATYGVREADLPARVLGEAARRFSFEARPAGLLGMSMGGSVAVHAASRPDAPWRALVVISSFDSFPPVLDGQARGYAGSALGAPLAIAAGAIYQQQTGLDPQRIQPHLHAARIGIPTLVAHGTKDQVIPLAAGRRLFDALPEPARKHWVEVPGAGHDNVLVTPFPIYAEIAAWMTCHASAQ